MVQNEIKQHEFVEEAGRLELLPPVHHSQDSRPNRRRGLAIALVVAVLAAGVLTFGIWSRVKAAGNLRTVTQQMAVPSVSAVLPKQTATADEVVLPGNIQ